MVSRFVCSPLGHCRRPERTCVTPLGNSIDEPTDRGQLGAATARLQRGACSCRRHGLLGPRRRGAWTGCRRSLLQHRDHRLPGDPDRPILCRADHYLYLSAYRQCRRQPRRSRDDNPGGARPGHPHCDHRAGQLSRHPIARPLAQILRHRRPLGRRYAAADPAYPRSRRAQRRHRLPPGRIARYCRNAGRGTRLARS